MFAYEDERGADIIESIDFWKSQRKSEIYPSQPNSPRNFSDGKLEI